MRGFRSPAKTVYNLFGKNGCAGISCREFLTATGDQDNVQGFIFQRVRRTE
jgi:hypothetical protein